MGLGRILVLWEEVLKVVTFFAWWWWVLRVRWEEEDEAKCSLMVRLRDML